MPQSLSRVVAHLVFSTHDRMPWIHDDIAEQAHRYMAGTLRGLGCEPIKVGGVEDHVHLLFGLSRTLTIAKTVEKLKTSATVFLKPLDNRIEDFHWQGGYGIFSVSEADVARVAAYIANQREHHRTRTFQEELLALLREYGISYDERYLWT